MSERPAGDQSERDTSMAIGDYPTKGWQFWAMLAGIVMIGLLGGVMALIARG
jgi:hypothetical protein